MEPSGIYTSSMGSGMLGLEMSLQPQQPPQNHHMGVLSYGHNEVDQHTQSVRQGFQQYAAPPPKAKNHQSLTLSDDEEAGGVLGGAENSADDAKRKTCSSSSPWHRMKWTDNMVRLLIMVVYYIGDEAGSEGGNNNDPSWKKKGGGGGGGGGGVLQKKGKWKSVSRAMLERGFYVSPQQCEDKFNDLNKRYKRVNDILGKGTACRVVENQALLETMDHLPQKMKDEVKKLLNSKHLFFREMCAYHNSCNHGGGNSTAGVQNSPEMSQPLQQQQQQQQQRSCLHSSSENVHISRAETEGWKMLNWTSSDEDDDDHDGEEDEEEDDDVVDGGGGVPFRDENDDERCSRKKQRKGGNSASAAAASSVQQLSCELMNLLQDGSKSSLDKREWMKMRMVQLEEERLGYQTQCFELEKQRLKWERFSSKKEREMERQRLANQQMRLENERMVLLIRQKELELFHLQ